MTIKGLLIVLGTLSLTPAALAAISGKVFQDINANATLDSTEPGVSNITVTAYDKNGATQGNTQTDSNGLYTLTPTGSPPYRIEFGDIPQYLHDSQQGTTPTGRIQFANSATTTNLNVALFNPAHYVTDANNTTVAVPVMHAGASHGLTNLTTEAGLLTIPYSATGSADGTGDINTPDPTQTISFEQVGSTWGTAYQKRSGLLFSSAILKRHSGLGPLVRPTDDSGVQDVPVDGIYKIQFNNSLNASYLGGFTVHGITPSTGDAGTIDLGTVKREVPANKYASRNEPYRLTKVVNIASYDVDAFDKAGTIGLGGSAIDNTDNFLWLINLKQKSLIRINIQDESSLPNSGAVAANRVSHFSIDISNLPNCQGEYRPWGISFHRSKGYVGMTCDASTGNHTDLHAHVLSFNPTTGGSFATELSIDLSPATYIRENSQFNADAGTCSLGTQAGWNRWTTSWTDLGLSDDGQDDSCPQPILSSLAFDTNGDMVLGFMDRLALQIDKTNYAPLLDKRRYFRVDAGGDTLHACLTGNGYVIEGATDCDIANDTKEDGDLPSDRFSLTDGPSQAGEFYYQDYPTEYEYGRDALHLENTLGSVTVMPGSGEVMVTTYDAIIGAFNQGFHWYRTRTTHDGGIPGSRSDQYQVAKESTKILATKGMGLGDLELLLPPAPLALGGRVWNDINGNGVQDANERGMDGVTVTLNCGGDNLTQTSANGGYYQFTDTTVTGGIPRNTQCTLSAPSAIDSQPLTTSTVGNNTQIDSNLDNAGNFSFTTGSAGQNNLSYDIGYIGRSADLELSKQASPSIAQRGDTITYTLTLTNQGSSTASNVVIEDKLPNAVSYTSSTASQGSYDATTALWTVGDLANGASATLSIEVTVK